MEALRPRTMPSRLYFDPYHETGIQITYSPDRIVLQLPRMGFWRTFPLYLFAGLFLLFGALMACMGIWHGQWQVAFFATVPVAVGIAGALYGQFQANQRANVEITPDTLIFTQFRQWYEPERIEEPWDRIRSVKIGFRQNTSEPPPSLVLTTTTGERVTILEGRTIEELERFEQLLKQFILPAAPASP